MSKSTLTIKLRSNYRTKNGKRSLYLYYIAYRRSSSFSLNISLHPEQWDDNLKKVVNHPYAEEYNRIISKTYFIAQTICFENYLSPLTVNEFFIKLKYELDPSPKKNNDLDFYKYIEREIELLKIDRRDGTIKNYYKLINTMKEWRPKLSFKEITFEYIQELHRHEIEIGNLESTIYKKHANFKFLLGIAVLKGKLNKNPYDKFPIKKITKAQNNDIITEDELKILQNAYDNNKYTDGKKEVLRSFLFSSYTGLSFVEFDNVTFADLSAIKVKDKGEYLILRNNRTKTGTIYKIPIVSAIVRSLIGSGNPKDKIFSPLTSQATNRCLKEIMEDLEIDKYITFHRARHSFRTIAAKRSISESIADRIMGHVKSNEIKDIYMHLHDEDIIEEMLRKWIV